MTENVMMMVVGLFLLIASFTVTGVSDSAMPPITKTYPPTRMFRVVLFVFGLLFVTLGLYRITFH